MSRQKKIKSIDSKETTFEEKTEVYMSQGIELESLQTEIDKARLELEQTKVEIEEKKKYVSANPRRDHDEMEMAISAKQVNISNEKATLKSIIEKQKACDSEMVKGKFLNLRSKGQSVKLTYQKYIDDPVKWYIFEDGKIYTIPRGFVDQLNEYYHTPVFIQKEGEVDPNRMGSSIQDVDTSNKKYAFVPLQF